MQIKEIRASKGISQRKAALDLGLSPVVYGRYENGIRKPEPEMLATIAAYLGVTVDELIGVGDSQDTKKEPAMPDKLDDALIEMLVNLSPEEVQRVQDFVSGMKASKTT